MVLLEQVDLVDTQVVIMQVMRGEKVVLENKLNLRSLVQQHQVMEIVMVL